MKILIIGDPHFKTTNASQTDVMVREIKRCIDETHPDMIVCLGDTLDKFSDYKEKPFNRAVDFFTLLQTHAPTYVLIGNHDLPTNDHFCSTQHPFNAVKKWRPDPHPITIIDEPHRVETPAGSLVFCPYVPSGRFQEALNRLPVWKDVRLIFAHQDFHGAVYRGQSSAEGDAWSPSLPMVISGHIHEYQHLGENIVYPGSPIQHAFDEPPSKSLLIVHLTNESIHHERWYVTVPIYYTYQLTADHVDTYTLPSLPPLSEIKLILKGSQSDIKAWNKSSKIKEWRQRGVKIQFHRLAESIERSKGASLDGEWKAVAFSQQLRDLVSPDEGLSRCLASL